MNNQLDIWRQSPSVDHPDNFGKKEKPIHTIKFSIIPSHGGVEAMMLYSEIPENPDLDDAISLSIAEIQQILQNRLRLGLNQTDVPGAIKSIRRHCIIQAACKFAMPLAINQYGEDEGRRIVGLLANDSVWFESEKEARDCIYKLKNLLNRSNNLLAIED